MGISCCSSIVIAWAGWLKRIKKMHPRLHFAENPTIHIVVTASGDKSEQNSLWIVSIEGTVARCPGTLVLLGLAENNQNY